jgi:hypothetical protein
VAGGFAWLEPSFNGLLGGAISRYINQLKKEGFMKGFVFAVVATFVAGTANAAMPLFAAKCSTNINVDSNAKGQVYVNGKVAQLIKRPDGQITAKSAGIYIDITPQGNEPPRVTYTAKDKSFGTCEILSFAAPGGAKASPSVSNRPSHSERAGQGQYDARTMVGCAERANQPMQQCPAVVTRDPGGMATVIVTRPDGRTRAIFFENGKAISADLSQADGSQHFRATKKDDVYIIEAGKERYEIVEAVVFGG